MIVFLGWSIPAGRCSLIILYLFFCQLLRADYEKNHVSFAKCTHFKQSSLEYLVTWSLELEAFSVLILKIPQFLSLNIILRQKAF